ncbi:MAG: hypothetical protein ACHQ2Z_07285 [Elusimicrobiota bacterium]
MTKPRDRGEKYVGPQILPEEAAGLSWSKNGAPAAAAIRVVRRRRLERHGEAHDLIKKLDFAILRELSKR